MHSSNPSNYNRRQFLKTAAVTGASTGILPGAGGRVSIVVDPADPVARAARVQWAAKELEQSLTAHGIEVRRLNRITQADGDLCILAAGSASAPALEVLKASGASVAAVPEALAITHGKAGGKPVLLACGHDAKGLGYALLELADRVQNSSTPVAALASMKAVSERPANSVRSVMRLFTSDVEDKPWYNDREMWPKYLTTLAMQRFNRFQLALGIGYDFLRNVTDAYFLFPYPFLLSVPGYRVRVPQLPDAERDNNLAMLKFISEQTVARGMQFQIGLWMHGYEWIDSPKPNYTIEGLTAETHGPYCRDAVRMLLKACPAITGVTFRIHGESGVEEGSYNFWKAVFEGVSTCGRTVELDMHAKGMDSTMLDLAVASGLPVKVSPKYWAEHMGMSYHQADIREQERPRADRQASGLMKFSAGSRSFTRYGYGDLLREDRRSGILHRIWPGTQRLLLWGDPLTAAAHARAFTFCGSDGVEIMEPLSFKGRRGSGIAGDRCAYADRSLKPRWDWEKYVYSHRVWGRALYNPDTSSEVFDRYLSKQFGPAGAPLGAALANASRILPIVTTGHGTSAANNSYWPEVYMNQSMVDADHPGPYRDTPVPRVFGNVSPFDPQLFSRINDFADELLAGERSGKYTPVEVAQWIEDYAASAAKYLVQAEAQATRKESPEYRRAVIDIGMQIGLGRFFASKFRSGVLYRLYERTGDRNALQESLKAYRAARAGWAELAQRGRVYRNDITVGENPQLRGHWLDRLPAIDADILAVAGKHPEANKTSITGERVALAIKEALGRPRRLPLAGQHVPPPRFRPGQPLAVELALETKPAAVRLYYRHVNHAERFQSAEMERAANRYRAAIPATYTDSPYPLQYYFEVREPSGEASLYPGFTADMLNQPYFVVRRG